jgi:hypothetical protein
MRNVTESMRPDKSTWSLRSAENRGLIPRGSLRGRATLCFLVLLCAEGKASNFPYAERLLYRVEWRMMEAGSATVQLSRGAADDWEIRLHLESSGLVNHLYRVLDNYKATSDDRFCAAGSTLDAQEGKKHTLTQLTFENSRQQVEYSERNLLKNESVQTVMDVAPCTYEITGALAKLRLMDLPPGKSANLPITTGKKMAYAGIDAQTKDTVSISGRTYSTIRYEAYVFDNVLYKRKGRLFIWLTDDADRLPVQLRAQMGFPIGAITLQLQRQERL